MKGDSLFLDEGRVILDMGLIRIGLVARMGDFAHPSPGIGSDGVAFQIVDLLRLVPLLQLDDHDVVLPLFVHPGDHEVHSLGS